MPLLRYFKIAVAVGMLALTLGAPVLAARHSSTTRTRAPLLVSAEVHEALTQATHWEDVFDYDRAQAIYQKLLDSDNHHNKALSAYLWYQLAFAQQADGNDDLALRTITKAIVLMPDDMDYRDFRSYLRNRREWPAGKPPPARYLALRDVGSAGRLVATNGLLHIFVRGKNSEAWSDFDITQAKFAIDQTTQWINGECQTRDIQPRPTFEHRYLVLPEEPFWRSVDVPGHTTPRELRAAWLKSVLQRYSADSFGDLFNTTFGGAPFRNRAVIFHVNQRARAYALPACVPSGMNDLETAFVYFPMKKIINPLESVTYAHELMHLYGADDLYNKVDDPVAASQDLMKFGSYRLERCQVCPITTYAIGWTDDLPHTTKLHIQQSLKEKPL